MQKHNFNKKFESRIVAATELIRLALFVSNYSLQSRAWSLKVQIRLNGRMFCCLRGCLVRKYIKSCRYGTYKIIAAVEVGASTLRILIHAVDLQ